MIKINSFTHAFFRNVIDNYSDPETLCNDSPVEGVQIVLILRFLPHAFTNVSIYTCMQGLDSGEKRHKITVALTRDNKLCNRFKNITVCK